MPSPAPRLQPQKFRNPDVTASGEPRAQVALWRLETLWINTGSLCNIACAHCYIESDPRNDRLAYFTAADAGRLYDEIAALRLGTREIGFTGGEPFMNPDLTTMASDALDRGFAVLILTNAMQPMQRPRPQQALARLARKHGSRLVVRVSLDHYSQALHERERGTGSWPITIAGLDWLVGNGVTTAVCGRIVRNEPEVDLRAGYRRLFAERGWPLDAMDPAQLVLLPEMDEMADVPEITTACWGILGVDPQSVMCARSRMVVRRKGADRPTVLPCTLIPYDPAFEMGATLEESLSVNGGMFDHGRVKLNHPHCARFCVLGGGSCSG